MERSRLLVVVFIAVQVVIPTLALLRRWTTEDVCFVPFGWQMFSCLPA